MFGMRLACWSSIIIGCSAHQHWVRDGEASSDSPSSFDFTSSSSSGSSESAQGSLAASSTSSSTIVPPSLTSSFSSFSSLSLIPSSSSDSSFSSSFFSDSPSITSSSFSFSSSSSSSTSTVRQIATSFENGDAPTSQSSSSFTQSSSFIVSAISSATPPGPIITSSSSSAKPSQTASRTSTGVVISQTATTVSSTVAQPSSIDEDSDNDLPIPNNVGAVNNSAAASASDLTDNEVSKISSVSRGSTTAPTPSPERVNTPDGSSVSIVSLIDNTGVPSPESTPSPTPGQPSADTGRSNEDRASPPVGALVGGILGGLALLVGIVVFLALFFRRRRAAHRLKTDPEKGSYKPSGDTKESPQWVAFGNTWDIMTPPPSQPLFSEKNDASATAFDSTSGSPQTSRFSHPQPVVGNVFSRLQDRYRQVQRPHIPIPVLPFKRWKAGGAGIVEQIRGFRVHSPHDDPESESPGANLLDRTNFMQGQATPPRQSVRASSLYQGWGNMKRGVGKAMSWGRPISKGPTSRLALPDINDALPELPSSSEVPQEMIGIAYLPPAHSPLTLPMLDVNLGESGSPPESSLGQYR